MEIRAAWVVGGAPKRRERQIALALIWVGLMSA